MFLTKDYRATVCVDKFFIEHGRLSRKVITTMRDGVIFLSTREK